jgi:hypothetical protein
VRLGRTGAEILAPKYRAEAKASEGDQNQGGVAVGIPTTAFPVSTQARNEER